MAIVRSYPRWKGVAITNPNRNPANSHLLSSGNPEHSNIRLAGVTAADRSNHGIVRDSSESDRLAPRSLCAAGSGTARIPALFCSPVTSAYDFGGLEFGSSIHCRSCALPAERPVPAVQGRAATVAQGACVRLLDRYLLETLLWAIVGVLGVLVILDGLSDLIDGLGDLSDTYGFSDLLIYIALTLPRRVEEFVPYATLIGALLGLGRLATSSELTIIRSAGVSMPWLAWMAVKPALIVALIGFGVGEYVAPVSEQIAVSQRALAQRDDPNLAGRYGAWNRDGGTFVHVDAVQRGGLIFGVTLIEFDESGALQRSVAADRGTFQGDRWLLEGVATTEITASGTQVSRQTTREWVSGITPNLLTLDTVEPASLPASQLWGYARYLRPRPAC